MRRNFKIQATASAGLESLVARELRNLGYAESVKIDDRSRVFFEGEPADIAKANLWLRTADRVKIVVGEFTSKTFDELFNSVFNLDWPEFLPLGSSFPVAKAKSVKSQLHNEPTIQAITKKAIVKRLQQHYHRPESLPLMENGPEYSIEVLINKDEVTILLDTTGESLFKRGYRTEHGGAPIKENLAAAIILLTTWPANPLRPFVDPTCGSGTFCIEAAMIAKNIAPGLNRTFSFEKWPWFMENANFEALKKEAKLNEKSDLKLDIQGYDIDGRMVEIARRNTVAAGLKNVIQYKQMRLQDFKSDLLDGVIISNPPYGERLGDEELVHKLYRDMGETFRPLDTWSKYIITADEAFETYFENRATKKRKLYNGALKSNVYQFFGKRLKK
ncbi:THUMP domain-containing class I SAM-dependent RNA methyltransferase [Lactovum miscens]|uniref:Putative N6-adenine-specific DNA methylase n=1 Tax=Lactovum miscens TaxID=190387 RepID=A0A841C1J6_9LACT|nr:class I SAM-dependent RNA methyltransferase [Lactovum miscens]MBB5887786.1 putative N6-adenine-specific DNA methylase [Lactovum miscens]